MFTALLGVIGPALVALIGFVATRGQKREREILALDVALYEQLETLPDARKDLKTVIEKRTERWAIVSRRTDMINFALVCTFGGAGLFYISNIVRGLTRGTAHDLFLQLTFAGAAFGIGGLLLMTGISVVMWIKDIRSNRSPSGQDSSALPAAQDTTQQAQATSSTPPQHTPPAEAASTTT